MGKERIVSIHVKSSEEYLNAAKKLLDLGEHFASVLCAATGAERAAMALVFHLGGRPAARHKHHEVLKILEPAVGAKFKTEYRKVTEAIAELMGHLTMVRYKYELAGEYKTPKEIYDEKTARTLWEKADKILKFVKRITQVEASGPQG